LGRSAANKNKLRNKRQTGRPPARGVTLIYTAFSIVFMCGMLGLAIDGGVAYFLKARLYQAVDAGCLAGARSLNRGQDLSSQAASAQATALKFFQANFPANFWGSSVSTPTTTVAVGTTDVTKQGTPGDPNSPYMPDPNTRYVSMRATATVPLYFMRVLGLNTVNISAFAQAARRDANIMIILDRSGSMKNAISQLVTSADWFVGNFAPGRDYVGLVTFGGTYNLIKPTQSFSPTVVNAINTLSSSTVGGTTNHSQPLWVAYQALAELNQPGALNAIIFFTDGQPNTVFADWETPDNPTTGVTNLTNPTTCNNGTYTVTVSGKSKTAYSPVLGYALVPTGSNVTPWGLFATTVFANNNQSAIPPYQPNSTAPGTVTTDYVNTAYDTYDSSTSGSHSELKTMSKSTGCVFRSDYTKVSSDFKQIPPQDYYGNATAPASQGYKSVTLTTFNATNLAAAAYNAGDQAAQRMRAGTLNGIVPLIDCIALRTTDANIDSTYMKRLANANDSANIIYNSSKPTGLYVYASSTGDLQAAFMEIASQILHLQQ